MHERLYRYRVVCDECGNEKTYEVNRKKELPEGWVTDADYGYGVPTEYGHYCPECAAKRKPTGSAILP